MVISILCLTISLILTFGKSSVRFFDRLGISFSFSLILQFTLLVVAILPHIKLESGMTIVHIICYLLVIIITLVYFYCNKTRLVNLLFVTGVNTTFYVSATVALSKVFSSDFSISIIICMLCLACVFSLSTDFKTAFLSILLTFVVSSFLVLFTPLYYAAEVNNVHVLFIDSLVPSLFVTMFLFNVFKRERVLQ